MATTWWSVFSSVFQETTITFVFTIENVTNCCPAVQTPGKLKSSLTTPSNNFTLFNPNFTSTQELTDEANKDLSTFACLGYLYSVLRLISRGWERIKIIIIILWITTHAKVIFAYRILWLHRRWFSRSPTVDTVFIVNTADRVDPSLLLLIRLRG